MRKTIHIIRGLLVIVAMALASGCATVSVPVNVTHPAEVNLSMYNGVVLGSISGQLGRNLEDEVQKIFVTAGKPKVFGRHALGNHSLRLRDTTADVAAEKARTTKGAEVADLAYVTGSLSKNIERKTEKQRKECTRSKTNQKYKCIKYTRTHKYVIRGELKIADVQTGIIFFNKKIVEDASKSTSAYDTSPANIDSNALKSEAMNKMRKKLRRALRPWNEKVYVRYTKDKALPGLEQGIKAAQGGMLEEAARIFKAEAERAEGDPVLEPKVKGIAYWNLGLAYEYSARYDEAIEAFRKAFELSSDMGHLKEVENVEKIRAEAEELKRQRGGN